MSLNYTFGLNLSVLSFSLPRNLIKESDDVRVSITTYPEDFKQAFVISARKMKDSHITFGVNITVPQEDLPSDFITTKTEKILIVFRKKIFFYSDPIIALTIINAKEFPKNLSQPAQSKTFNLYEPIFSNDRNGNNKNNYQGLCDLPESTYKKNKQRIVGCVHVQMSLTDPFHLKDFSDDQMYAIKNDKTNGEHNYTNDLFKIGVNHFRFRVLDE